MTTPRRLAGLAVSATLGVVGLLGLQTPAQASTSLSNVYEHADWGGLAKTFYHGSDGYVCTGSVSDVDLQFSSMPSGWDNRVSSFYQFATCYAKLWELTWYQGASLGYQGTTSWVGPVMNDQTSSIQFS
ncbi:hypothetical protein ABZS66_36225 [Dactylosporangium sp. NPDC005572]|uniref:hypothetical protein n=1 Tax=Dactylosporangium sp. NPDC005572 TaxID=3156889 RepID=UPI0033A94F3B